EDRADVRLVGLALLLASDDHRDIVKAQPVFLRATLPVVVLDKRPDLVGDDLDFTLDARTGQDDQAIVGATGTLRIAGPGSGASQRIGLQPSEKSLGCFFRQGEAGVQNRAG